MMTSEQVDQLHGAVFGYSDNVTSPVPRPPTSYGNRPKHPVRPSSAGVGGKSKTPHRPGGRPVKRPASSKRPSAPAPPVGGLNAAKPQRGVLPPQGPAHRQEERRPVDYVSEDGAASNALDEVYDGAAVSPTVNRFYKGTDARRLSHLDGQELDDTNLYGEGNHMGVSGLDQSDAADRSRLQATGPHPPPPRTAATVREAAFSTGACTTLGRRLLQWAEGAGIKLTPPPAVFDPTYRFSKDPSRFKQMYRRCCLQSRSTMDRYADPTAVGAVLRSCDASVQSSPRKVSGSFDMSHRTDPNNTSHQTTASTMSSGLRQVRLQREYSLWCQWQLNHFFDKGPSYITNVWRHMHSSPAMANPDALSGRYVIPTDSKISSLVATASYERKRLRYFAKLLREEFGLQRSDVGEAETTETMQQRSPSLANKEAGSPAAGQDSEGDEDDEEATMDDALTGSRRASRLAATQPYIDVLYDIATARLQLSVYVNGEGDEGEGATFFHKCTAGCLDNFRWILIDGLWRGRILFFVPRFAFSPVKDERAQPDALEQVVVGIDSLIVQGMSWKRVKAEQVSSSPKDPFVCMRCGHLRVQQNIAKVSAQTGQLQRDRFFCVLCRRKTRHVKAPPQYPEAREMLRLRLASIPDVDGDVEEIVDDEGNVVEHRRGEDIMYLETSDRSMATASHRPRAERIRAAYQEAVHHLAYGSAMRIRPHWRRCRNVDQRSLFGPYISLGAIPAKPKLYKKKK